jgi:MFS family permease
MALPFLALYLTVRLGRSGAEAGLALTLYGAGAMLTAPLSGKLSDWMGPLRMMKLALFGSGTILAVFGLVRGYAAILLATFIWAIVSEAFRPASMAILTDVVEVEQRKPAYALHRLAVNLGMSVGPAVGGFLAAVSFPILFLVDGATSVLAGLVLVMFHWPASSRERGNKPHNAQPASTRKRLSAFADRRLIYFLIALLPVEMVFFQTQAAMPLFLVEGLGLKESTYGLLLTVNTVAIILLEVPLNTMMALWSHRWSLVLGASLTGIGFGALAIAGGIPAIAATVLVWTFGEMILMPGSTAYVAEIAPADRRGEYMGLYTMSFSVAFAIGPLLGAASLARFGGTALWVGTLVFGLISATLMLRLKAR